MIMETSVPRSQLEVFTAEMSKEKLMMELGMVGEVWNPRTRGGCGRRPAWATQ